MIEDTTETMSPSSDTPLEEPSDEDTSAPHGHSEAPAEEDTPIVSAVEQAEELHDLADQAAGELIGEAAEEAQEIQDAADETAREVFEQAAAEGQALEELGDRAGAEEIIGAGRRARCRGHGARAGARRGRARRARCASRAGGACRACRACRAGRGRIGERRPLPRLGRLVRRAHVRGL